MPGTATAPTAFVRAYEQATNSHDLARVAPLITPEAVYWFSDGSHRGRDAILAAIAQTLADQQNRSTGIDNCSHAGIGSGERFRLHPSCAIYATRQEGIAVPGKADGHRTVGMPPSWGCSHHTVARYVAERERGRPPRRPGVIGPFLPKLEELVDRSRGRSAPMWRTENITAGGLYRLVDAAYEKRSVAVSSNLHPSGFDELMPKTPATATVTVDRPMHQAGRSGGHQPAEMVTVTGQFPMSLDTRAVLAVRSQHC